MSLASGPMGTLGDYRHFTRSDPDSRPQQRPGRAGADWTVPTAGPRVQGGAGRDGSRAEPAGGQPPTAWKPPESGSVCSESSPKAGSLTSSSQQSGGQ